MSRNAARGAPTLEVRAERLLHVLVGFVAALVCMYGVGLFCLQGYMWLRFGTWVELPAAVLLMDAPPPAERTVTDNLDAVASGISFADFRLYIPYLQAPKLAEWLRHPTSWFGLHKLASYALNLISVPVLMVVVGWWIASASFAVADDLPTSTSTRPTGTHTAA
jgi:hypothetical protein